MMDVMRDIGGVDLPDYLGRMVVDPVSGAAASSAVAEADSTEAANTTETAEVAAAVASEPEDGQPEASTDGAPK